MFRLNPIRLFVCRFVLVYALLAIPWPGLNTAYGHYFRALGRMVFGDNDRRELSFEAPGENERHLHDTRIVIVNRALMHADGSGPVRNLDMNASGFSRATALLLALIFATPIPWRRRVWAMVWGLLWIHAFILLFLGFCIWNESAEIGLVTLSPFWKSFANGLKEAVIAQLSLAISVLIWILVTFRRGDRLGEKCPRSASIPCKNTNQKLRQAV